MKELIEKLFNRIKEFIQKNWWDVRYLLLLAFAFLLLRFGKFIKWLIKDTGSVADWVNDLGTIGAFIIIFWQIKKEAEIQRAIKIEEQRPRFAMRVVSDNNFPDANVTFLGKWDKISEIITNIRNNNVIRNVLILKNISRNDIYSITIRIKYTENNEVTKFEKLGYSGIGPYENLVLLSDFNFNDESKIYGGLVVRFITPANEMGFFEADKLDSKPKYYYVETKNKSVSVNDVDEIINKKSAKYKELNDGMDDENVSYNYYDRSIKSSITQKLTQKQQR